MFGLLAVDILIFSFSSQKQALLGRSSPSYAPRPFRERVGVRVTHSIDNMLKDCFWVSQHVMIPVTKDPVALLG